MSIINDLLKIAVEQAGHLVGSDATKLSSFIITAKSSNFLGSTVVVFASFYMAYS